MRAFRDASFEVFQRTREMDVLLGAREGGLGEEPMSMGVIVMLSEQTTMRRPLSSYSRYRLVGDNR
jgi:hypothetical protein